MQIDHASQLSEVDQAFVDAVFAHNGRQPPRPPRSPTKSWMSFPSHGDAHLRLLQVILKKFDPDMGYNDWFRVAAGVFNETRGHDDGFALFDQWSSQGDKYRGVRETTALWEGLDLDHPTPVTMATLRRMVEANGHDWSDICAEAEGPFPIVGMAPEDMV